MKKFINGTLVPLLTLSIVVGFSFPLYAHAQIPAFSPTVINAAANAGIASGGTLSGLLNIALTPIFNGIAATLLTITSWVTMLGGLILNYAINYTVVNMAKNFATQGIGSAINTTWTAVRDLVNMSFIFFLLYTAIMTIFGKGDYKKTVVNMVIAAILINFSLFFTKIIIDAANLLTMLFYNAAAPGALADTSLWQTGLSNSVVDILHISTLFKLSSPISPGNLLLTGIMGSVVLLICGFVFFAVALMFVIRYVVLVLVLILSPIMFLGMILPQLGSYTKQWWSALSSQAFFAPIFMLMMWVSIKVLQSIALPADFSTAFSGVAGAAGATASTTISVSPTMASTFINFSIVIVFIIAALLISKKYSEKAGGFVNKLTGTLTNGAFGLTGTLGRKTAGRIGNAAAQNSNLIKAANEKTGFTGAAARLALYASKKTANATFDVRNATVPTGMASDLVRGTVGRTDIGRKLGLDKFEEIGSIAVGAPLTNIAGTGQGGSKGFREEQIEKNKKFSDLRAKQEDEARLAAYKLDILKGTTPTATPTDVSKMETAIGKMSDKEIEAIVSGNKELLESQAFASKISVQQLEALNKSDKLSDEEKSVIKGNRFRVVSDGITALAVPQATRNAAQNAAVTALPGAIKGLADKELEMIDPEHLQDPAFIEQLKPSQIEGIMKSSKFTSSQKKFIGDERKRPIIDNLNSGTPNLITLKKALTKDLSIKDVSGLMSTNVNNPAGGNPIPLLTHPDVLPIFTPNMLKRMGQEMNTTDVQTVRNQILATAAPLITLAANPAFVLTPEARNLIATANWLNSPDGVNFS